MGGDDCLTFLVQAGVQCSMLQQHGYVYLLLVLMVPSYHASGSTGRASEQCLCLAGFCTAV